LIAGDFDMMLESEKLEPNDNLYENDTEPKLLRVAENTKDIYDATSKTDLD
jgi:hypothetical protein